VSALLYLILQRAAIVLYLLVEAGVFYSHSRLLSQEAQEAYLVVVVNVAR
jgi:BarA-like signal transduction histidine kinase